MVDSTTRSLPRRSQQQRRSSTRSALLASARQLFSNVGYNAAGIDSLAANAGLTKGALYHHYPNKRALFEAVCEQWEDEQHAAVRAVRGRGRQALLARVDVFLDYCADPGFRRVVLVDGPTVLGLARWDQPAVRRSGRHIDHDLAAILPELDPDTLHMAGRMLVGALTEAAKAIAGAENPNAARRNVRRVIQGLLQLQFAPA